MPVIILKIKMAIGVHPQKNILRKLPQATHHKKLKRLITFYFYKKCHIFVYDQTQLIRQ
jgi:hypothetical protein